MKNYNYLLFPLLLLFNNSFAQSNDIKKEKWHWNNTQQDTLTGYAQVVKVDNILYISGVVSSELTPTGIDRVYKALEFVLKSNGATFQNVVKENLYTTDIEEVKKCNYIRKRYYNSDYPAATWVQITRLFMENAKLEVELIAHLPK
ncbi:MAG TPA: RidA family protein [Rikenellaceae bacterium]|nr:RidA family protein [Rikenellaceae bacterium]